MQDAFAKRVMDRNADLQALFRDSVSRIERQIDGLYMRYASSQGISIADMKQRVSAMDIRQYAERARKAVADRDFSPETNKWLKTYNLKMRVNRLELTKAYIDLELAEVFHDEEALIREALTREMMIEFEHQSGILGQSVGNPPKELTAIIDADFYGYSFSQRIWDKSGQFERLRGDLYNHLTSIYLDMDGYQKQKRKLMEAYQTTEYEASRLLRTEMGRVSNDTRKYMYENEEFTHYQYLAEYGACEHCQALDGTVHKVSEAITGLNYPLMHPNCLCSTLGIVNLTRVDGRELIDEYRDNYEGQYKSDNLARRRARGNFSTR